ncbi:MAG: acetate--CoA ligase family protein [Thermomicrobiales bacterium]|nr:acetate--CoA ligase family protein [Thermomicrobiales bacterium]
MSTDSTVRPAPMHLPEEASSLLDGKRPLKRDRLANLARKRMAMGADWIAGSIGSDGRFAYLYYPETNTYNRNQYNEVRHAGTIYSLFQCYDLNRNSRWLEAAESACRWLFEASVPTPFGGKAFCYKGRMKLGGQALALVALLERRRVLKDSQYDDLIADLTVFLDALEMEDSPGQYFNSYLVSSEEMLPTPESDYYPGEALLAITRLAQHFPDGPFLEQAVRAGEFLTRVKDGDIVDQGVVPRHDHWLAMALCELYPQFPSPVFAKVAYMQAEAMMASQYPGSHPNWRQIGGSRRGKSVNYTSTATKAEAMNAVWGLAVYRGDEGMVELVSEAALRTVQFGMRVQYTSEIARNFPRPSRVVGAWAQDEQESYVRVDFVQHNISALAGAYHLVKNGRLPMANESERPQYGRASLVRAESTSIYRGPSRLSEKPVVHVVLDVKGFESGDQSNFDDVAERLAELHGVIDPAGEPTKLNDVGEALALLMLGLQRLGGWDVSFSKARRREGGGFDVICEYVDPTAGRETAEIAIVALDDLLQGISHASSFVHRFERAIINPATTEEIGDTPRFIREARRRGIPLRQPIKASHLMDFGNGKYLKQFWRLWTSDTTILGTRFARNKNLASQLLRDRGLPVPANVLVTTVEQAVSGAARIGYPVVLKPLSENHSKGVMTDIRDEAELRSAFERTASFATNKQIVVEKFLEGISYRILVIDFKVWAVLEREIASVTGDGVSTVEELVAVENARPERQAVDGNFLAAIQINEQTAVALAKQGLTLTDVPEKDRVVKVKLIPSGANGGTRVDVTDQIHPDNAAIAVQACRSMGIDLGGLDFLAPDISKSVWETGGGIVEINTAPGLYPHYQPTAGPARDPVPAILEMLFPPGQPVRVPVVAIAGSGDLDEIAETVGRALTNHGLVVGRVVADGAHIGSMHARTQGSFGPSPHHMAMYNPSVEIVVTPVRTDDLAFPGLEFNEVDIVVIAGAEEESDTWIQTPSQVVARMVEAGGTVVAGSPGVEAIEPLLAEGVELVIADIGSRIEATVVEAVDRLQNRQRV